VSGLTRSEDHFLWAERYGAREGARILTGRGSLEETKGEVQRPLCQLFLLTIKAKQIYKPLKTHETRKQ
jgi:hypothetical protein